jgi:flagellar assembly factor FliW
MKFETFNMKFTLPRFGSAEIEIDPSTIIEFPAGLPGFENCQRFKLFHSEGSDPSVFWLQSLDDVEVVFSLTDPDLLNISYELTLNDEEQRLLRSSPDDDLHIAVMLSRKMEEGVIASDYIQANTKAPIVINATKRIAMQKTLGNALQEIMENGAVSIRA